MFRETQQLWTPRRKYRMCQNVPSRVRVTVHSGLELPSKDWDTGASDPYVEIRVANRQFETQHLGVKR